MGAAALNWTSPNQMRAFIGAALIAFSVYSLVRPTLPAVKGGKLADGIVGLLSGAFSGSTGLAGIPVIVWASLRRWSKDDQRAVFQPVVVAVFVMTLFWFGGSRYSHGRDAALVLDRVARRDCRDLAWVEVLRQVGRGHVPGRCPRAVARFRDYAAAVAVEHTRMNKGFSLDRRALLAGLGAAALLPARVLAAPPHRLKLGEFDITVLSDGHLTVPTRFLARNASEAEIASAIGVGTATVTPPCNVTLVRTPSETILIDVGSGPHYMPGAGKLAENMEAAGIDRHSISKVVFSHAHPDHLWGLLE